MENQLRKIFSGRRKNKYINVMWNWNYNLGNNNYSNDDYNSNTNDNNNDDNSNNNDDNNNNNNENDNRNGLYYMVFKIMEMESNLLFTLLILKWSVIFLKRYYGY